MLWLDLECYISIINVRFQETEIKLSAKETAMAPHASGGYSPKQIGVTASAGIYYTSARDLGQGVTPGAMDAQRDSYNPDLTH